MVEYKEYAPTKGVSPGVIWQDSALSAARMIEKYMSQEEQLVRLSDLHANSYTEYDRSNGAVQLRVEELTVGSPLGDHSGPTGSLAGTSFMWRGTREGVLRIWDSLDRTNVRCCEFVASCHSILVVDVLKAKTGWFLIVATTWDVSLFYFDPIEISDTEVPVFSGLLSPTGGAEMTCIACTESQIFLGAADGSLFEFVYDSRCYLSIISRPFTSSLPNWFVRAWHWLAGSASGICSIATDVSRNLLFAVTASDVQIFDTVHLTRLAHYTEYSLQTAIHTGNAPVDIVSVVPSSTSAGGEVVCVVVTRIGWRLILTLTRVLSAKNPPRHPHLAVERAFSPDGGRTLAFACVGGLGVLTVEDARDGVTRERWDWVPIDNFFFTAMYASSLMPWSIASLGSEGICYLVGSAGPDRTSAAELASQLTRLVGTEHAAAVLDRFLDPALSHIDPEPVPATHLLGGLARPTNVSVSLRTRGLALFLARELKSVWFQKAFQITCMDTQVTIRPGPPHRDSFTVHVLAPLVAMFSTYKPLLTENNSYVEGFSVLLSATQECMELFRIVDTGQLQRKEVSIEPELLARVERLLVRDIVLSAGVGDPTLRELLSKLDIGLAGKYCPLLI